MILGIDASSIKIGGGLNHLVELLCNADPQKYGFDKVVLWACDHTLEKVSTRTWLLKRNQKLLNKSLICRVIWQTYYLPSLAKKNCDILFTLAATSPSFYPFVTICHNLLPFDDIVRKKYGKSFVRIRLELLRKQFLKSFSNASGIIFLTNFSKQSILEFNKSFSTKSIVIPHGVGAIFSNFSKQREYLKIGRLKLLYISTIDAYKNQYNLLRAVYNLLEKGYDIELTLIGAKNFKLASKIFDEELIRCLKYSNKIRYLGEVNYEKVSAHYINHDIFVFPSACEAFGLTLLEAMASGMPIACSNTSSMPEILGDAGIYFDPVDISSIESSLLTLISDSNLRESLGMKAMQKAKQYSWRQCADDTFNFLKLIYTENKINNKGVINVCE